MAGEVRGNSDQAVLDALRHLEAALQLLDSAGAPAQIGAHVDLAMCQLRDSFPGGSRRDQAARAEGPTRAD